jgi:hypothetical protein
MIHTSTMKWAFPNKLVQSHPNLVQTLVVKTWEMIVPICRITYLWKRDVRNLKTIKYSKVQTWNCLVHIGESKVQRRCNFWGWWKQVWTVAETQGAISKCRVSQQQFIGHERTISWNWRCSLHIIQERSKAGLNCTVLYCTVLYCIVLYCAVALSFFQNPDLNHKSNLNMILIHISFL